MTSADPTGMHDWHSDEYVQDWIDNQRDDERAVLLRRVVHLIPFDPDDEIRVLDIGGGYGALTKVVLDAYPHAQVVLHDYSEPMLSEARKRLATYSDSVSYVRGDLMTPAWTDALKGEFQAIVSSIAIHNVRYPGRIRGTYQELFPFLAQGGCFLNFDLMAPDGELSSQAERHAQLMERRRQIHEESGVWKKLAEIEADLPARRRVEGGASQRADASEDEERATLTNQLKWLREAGFSESDCFWRDARRALIGAFRAR
jgi:tRNA (cmo5U34)-methyltransferase